MRARTRITFMRNICAVAQCLASAVQYNVCLLCVLADMNGYQWSMDQDLEPSPTALHGHPVVCSEPPPINRDEPFKQLLLTLARKMDRNNSSELAYAAGCNLPETAPPALEVLRELEKQGSFSARCCSNLENLLRRIDRCDLAELVVKHMESFPDLPQAKSEFNQQ